MATPFDQCGVLEVAMGRTRTAPRPRNTDIFQNAGKLFAVVDPNGYAHYFSEPDRGLLPPEEINKRLERMGLRVRVSYKGVPYSMEE